MDEIMHDEAEEIGAADMLRAFEDEHFGKDVPRVSGHVEKGHGSKYMLLDPAIRARHDALTKLVAAEKAMSDANAALSKAKADHADAKAVVDQHSA